MVSFEENVGLVYYVYNTVFHKYKEHEEDIIQEGLMGLWKACQTFDCSRGVEFSTYAHVVIRNSMGMYVRKMLQRPIEYSLDMPISADEPETFLSLIAYEDKTLEDKEREYIVAVIKEAAKKLDSTEIVEMKLKGMKQIVIAKKLNLHPSTVSDKMRKVYDLAKKTLDI